MKKRGVIYNRRSLLTKYNVVQAPNSSWNNPSNGEYLGYHSFRSKEHPSCVVSWYTEEFPACCGAILVHSYNISGWQSEEERQGLADFMTEYLHNMMNRMQRPLTIGILTSGDWQNTKQFKKAGWLIPKGVQSVKHPTTTGDFVSSIKNILFPAYLFVKNAKRFKLPMTKEDEYEIEQDSDWDSDYLDNDDRDYDDDE